MLFSFLSTVDPLLAESSLVPSSISCSKDTPFFFPPRSLTCTYLHSLSFRNPEAARQMGAQAGGRPTSSAPGLRDDAAGSSGGKPGTTRASRSPSRLHSPSPADSSASLNTTQSSQSRKEYMDSLVVPPKEELVCFCVVLVVCVL